MPASSAITKPISNLFVCRSNLCRSPLADAILHPYQVLAYDRYGQIDSAGTPAHLKIEHPDPQTTRTLKDHGILHVMEKAEGKYLAIFDHVPTVGTKAPQQLQHSCRRQCCKLPSKLACAASPLRL